jgi:hypothetical protein
LWQSQTREEVDLPSKTSLVGYHQIKKPVARLQNKK